MYEIAFGRPPFSADAGEEIETEIGIFDKILSEEVKTSDEMDPLFNEIMLCQMNRNANNRMNMSEVLNHAYFAGATENLENWKARWVKDYEEAARLKEEDDNNLMICF